MVEDRYGKIILTGDTHKCSHCEEKEQRFKETLANAKHLEYEYIDVNTDKGQEKLKEYGVREGEKADIPIVKVQGCKIDTDEKGEKVKKCGKEKDWKEEMWDDIKRDELPESVYID